MHTRRLSLICTTSLLLALGPVSSAHAQSFLEKFADKIQKAGAALPAAGAVLGGVGGLGQLGGSDAAQIEADRADTTLDKRPRKEDRRGFGGIYYPNFVLGAESINQEKAYAIGKVLIEYDEDKAIATLYTRHAFEANDPAKLVSKAIWGPHNTGRYVNGLKKLDRVILTTPSTDTINKYKYLQQSYRKDLQGNDVADKQLPSGLGILLELEPGVIYVGNTPYAGSKTQPFGHNLLKPGYVVPLMYKEGKAEAAATWTIEKIIAHYQKLYDAADRASEAADAEVDPNLALLPPSDPAPTAKEMDGARNQWQRVISDRNVADTQSQRKFKLVYVYPTSPWSDMRKKQYVNNSWVDTIISRSRVYSATFQDQEGKYWNNRFYLVEKAPMGVYFGERWSGDYDYALPASAVPKALGKEAALKYQNAVKAK